MDKVWNFAKRHRGKLVVAGVVSAVSAGGLYLVHKLAEAKYREWKEQESKEMMEKVRQQHHFESTWRTGNVTLKSAIMPALLEALSNAIDTDDVVAKIKECKNLAEKVQLWNQLKEMAFGRCLALILCTSFVEVLLRCQLSILAGYSYRDTVDKKVLNDQNDNNRSSSSQKLSTKVQEKYLSLCQVFIVKVVPTFFNDVIDGIVGGVVKDVDLNQLSSVADIQKYLNEMIDLSDNFCVQETRKLLQSDAFDADALDDAEKSTLDVLFVETIDVLECRQLVDQALTTSTTVALNVVVDKIAEKFPATRVGSDDGGLLHPEQSKLPLAKLIPVLCGLIPATTAGTTGEDFRSFEPNTTDQVKTFASNVYHSFSMPATSYQ